MPAKVSQISTSKESYLHSRLGIVHSSSSDCLKKDIGLQRHRESHLHIDGANAICRAVVDEFRSVATLGFMSKRYKMKLLLILIV